MEGGSEPQNVWSFLPVIVPGIILIWGVVVGGYYKDWMASGVLPSQGAKKAGGDETSERDVWYLVLSPIRKFPAASGLGDDGDLHLQAPEYGCTVHRDTTFSRSLSGWVAEDGLTGPQSVVGSGEAEFCGSQGGGGGRRGTRLGYA